MTTTTNPTITTPSTTTTATGRWLKVSVPPEFRGTESADRWFSRYEICVRSNGWDDGTRLSQVLPLMGGEALDVLLEMTDGELQDYEVLKACMVKEFDLKDLREHYVQLFKSRKLQEGEEFNVFMRALKVLARKAYPNFEDIPRNHLIDDRYREEMPDQVRTMLPFLHLEEGDLEKLVTETRQLYKASKVSTFAPAPRVAPVVEGASAGIESTVTNDLLLRKLTEIEKRMQDMSSSQSEMELRVNNLYSKPPSGRGTYGSGWDRGANRTGPGGGSRPKVICYRCNRPGHIRRECPEQSTLGRVSFHLMLSVPSV